jgi:uncharacterized protein DUF3558
MNNDENTAGGVRSSVVARWVAPVAALLVLLAGCVGQTRSASPLGHLEPCDLLDAAGRSALGVTEGHPADMGSIRACSWHREDAVPGDDFEIFVQLFDANDSFDSSAPYYQPLLSIGSHRAFRYIDPDGSCMIGIGARAPGWWLTESGVAGGDPRQRCHLADQLAALIEPKLP